MAPAIGIDLGTTFSCVAILSKNNIKIIDNDLGKRTTPSYVSFSDKERLVGAPAKRKAAINPTNTIYDVKRLIGRRFDDPTIQEDMKHWPFNVINVGGKPMIKTKYLGEDKVFAPEEISAMILTKMKDIAEKHLGTEVKDAVITVPAYFNDSQRQATKDAGAIAGLNVLRIINEPTAAALAYGLQKEIKGKRKVLIYDLGGGTFDVTVLTIKEGSVFKVKSTSGNTHLGGENFDRRIVKFLKEKLEHLHNKKISCDHKIESRLKAAAEVAKLEVSSSIVSSIDLDVLFDSKDFSTELTRACFNELCMDLFKKTLLPVKLALADAKMDKDSIDDIVLVGGSTRIPKVQEILQEFFSGKELNYSINPDEAVAYGAAIEAAILSGDESSLVKDILLVDVTPLSLGVEIKGGLMSRVIERNTQIPCKMTKNFTTVQDNQTSVTIRVFEGERSLVTENNFLGEFVLCGIPPGPAGKASIDETFDLDANSILKVSAVETTEGSSRHVTIREGKSNLSPAEINRMRREAQRFKAEDEREFARITERNSLDFYILKARNALDQPGNNLSFWTMYKGKKFCNDTMNWIKANPAASKAEIENQKSKLSSQMEKIVTIV